MEKLLLDTKQFLKGNIWWMSVFYTKSVKYSPKTLSTKSAKPLWAMFSLPVDTVRLAPSGSSESLSLCNERPQWWKHHYMFTHLLISLSFPRDPDPIMPPPLQPTLQPPTPKFELRIYFNQRAASVDTCRRTWSKVSTLLYQSERGCQK